MNCDKELHAKLNDYELTRIMNDHCNNLFIRKPESGKISLLYSLFKSKLLKRCRYRERQCEKSEIGDEIQKDIKYILAEIVDNGNL